MRKLSEINEGMFAPAVLRSKTGDVRKEDDSPFYTALHKIKMKKSQFVDLGVGDVLWTPFNFGSDDISKSGLYLSGEEIAELYDYLKDTEFEIATQSDFIQLEKCQMSQDKIEEDVWEYVFERNNSTLHIPNFGYIDIQYKNGKRTGFLKSDAIHLGSITKDYKNKEDFLMQSLFLISSSSLACGVDICPMGRILNKYQVRLVKRIKQ